MKYILLLSLFLTGCSAFQPKQQQITINSYKRQQVQINDKFYTIPTTMYVDRDKTLTISKKEGKFITYTKSISPVPSIWGKLDTWGVYFLYPGIGLFTPGALELETNIINID